MVLFDLRHPRLPGLEVFLRSLPLQPRRMRRGLLMEQIKRLTLMRLRKENSAMGRIQRWGTCSALCFPLHPCVKQQSSPKPWSLLTYLTPGWQLSQWLRETSLLALAIPLSPQSSGFGWFSWFRSKPASSVSTSGDEDSSDSSDSEVTSTDGLATLPCGPQSKSSHNTAWHHFLPGLKERETLCWGSMGNKAFCKDKRQSETGLGSQTW